MLTRTAPKLASPQQTTLPKSDLAIRGRLAICTINPLARQDFSSEQKKTTEHSSPIQSKSAQPKETIKRKTKTHNRNHGTFSAGQFRVYSTRHNINPFLRRVLWIL
jgi:hypothetical protein